MASKIYVDDLEFDGNSLENVFPEGDVFDGCTFRGFIMPSFDLSTKSFEQCTFIECDLSLCIVEKTSLKKVSFDNCRLMGIKFEQTNPMLFSVRMETCIADYSSFSTLNMTKSTFAKTSLKEVDFTEAELEGLTFEECDLQSAVFDHCNLSRCDFSKAHNLSFLLESNRLSKTKINQETAAQILARYGIEIVY
jgi:fluoroquinolone resistance protein